jgi:hypothetical protein
MPEISRFFGIIIRMYFGDHPPPLHAEYGGSRIKIEIATLSVIDGELPPRALGLVTEWAALHQAELLDLWRMAAANQPLHRLPPLQ